MPDAALLSSDTQSALAALSEGLRDYQRVSGKLSAAILQQKGAQLLWGNQNPAFGATFDGLVQLFFRQAPRSGAIRAAAAGRHFRLGRTLYGGALSPRALEKARTMMGGFKTILANASEDGSLAFVRSGVRKARVYFRFGRKSFPVSGRGNSETFAGVKQAGDKVLNLRAVATYFEIQMRERGRGFLGAGWLFKRWRSLARVGYVPAGTAGLAEGVRPSKQFGGVERRLVNVNPRSFVNPLGDAALTGDDATGNLTLRISSHIPGTLAIGEGRQLFARAMAGVRADMDAYFARQHAEMLTELIRQRGDFRKWLGPEWGAA
jgi:hypothetical protein